MRDKEKMRPLTNAEQNLIEDSLWIVNTVLKNESLQCDNDLRQSAILYMCECLLRFDCTKNIKWSTYAYRNISLFIKRTNAKQKFMSSKIVDVDIIDLKESRNNNYEDLNVSPRECLLSHLTPKELEIWAYLSQGYKGNELCDILGYNIGRIYSILQSIKFKARGIKQQIKEKNY